MVEIAPFKPEHLAALRLQAAQASAQHLMTVTHGDEIAACHGDAFTAFIDGEPIMCSGFIQIWPGRAYTWAYLSDAALRHMREIHRATLKGLAAASRHWGRIEMAIDLNHTAAKRWAEHLGFVYEGTHRKWTMDGRDVECWARVAS